MKKLVLLALALVLSAASVRAEESGKYASDIFVIRKAAVDSATPAACTSKVMPLGDYRIFQTSISMFRLDTVDNDTGQLIGQYPVVLSAGAGNKRTVWKNFFVGDKFRVDADSTTTLWPKGYKFTVDTDSLVYGTQVRWIWQVGCDTNGATAGGYKEDSTDVASYLLHMKGVR